MKIFSRGNCVFLLIVLTIQQMVLAYSSYMIAQAGIALTEGQRTQSIHDITMFFLFALLAYVLSASCAVWETQIKNKAWFNYVQLANLRITNDQRIVSEKNKRLFNSWISVEAKNTIERLFDTAVSLFSLYLNAILTLIVFWITLSPKVVGILILSALLLLLLLWASKARMFKLANENQSLQVDVMSKVETLWHGCIYGNKNTNAHNHSTFSALSDSFFRSNNKIVAVEQLIASLPIVFCVLLIVLAINQNAVTYGELGAMVALLPRTLQLLGNIHELGASNGRLVFLFKKYSNLKTMNFGFELQNLEAQIAFHLLSVHNVLTDQKIEVEYLIQGMAHGTITQGRYLLTGENGTGKSSLFRLLKEKHPSALVISPASEDNTSVSLSSGQNFLEKLNRALTYVDNILMLDEWDANLDQHNTQAVHDRLNEVAQDLLLLEIRHL
jgi:ABC-type bacteriocin/lantibiotic exporter with double-glycine peptidase domain